MALSFYEWRLVLMAMFLLPCIAISLNLFGYKKTKASMDYFIKKKSFDKDTLDVNKDTIYQIARMIKIAATYGPYRANCLKQCLLLWWLLARNGVVSEIKFGVNKQTGLEHKEMKAHAWVDYKGEILIDSLETQALYTDFN